MGVALHVSHILATQTAPKDWNSPANMKMRNVVSTIKCYLQTQVNLFHIQVWWQANAQLKKYKDVNKLPGPPPLQLLWQTINSQSSYEKYQYVASLNKLYGPIIKLWIKPFKPAIMVADADLMNKILMSREHLQKTEMYDLLKPYMGEGLATTSDRDAWKKARKMCNSAFQHNTVTSFLPIFRKNTDLLLESLNSETEKAIDTQPVIHLYTLDIIFETLLKKAECFQEKKNSSYLNARLDYFTILAERLYSVFLANELFFRISSSFKVMQKALNVIKYYTLNIINTEEANVKNGNKATNHLIDVLFANNVHGEVLNDQINTFILAGHDTTAEAMCFTMYELSKLPQIQRRLFEEIVSVVGKDPNAEITNADLQEMKYLEAVVKESLRYHPVVPIIERKISHSIEFNGVNYPKDTKFMFHIGGVHKSEKYFSNPEKFDPDRFMPDNAHLLQKNAYVAFSLGPRDCIGRFYAMLEIKYFIAKCVQKFELLPVENHSLQVVNEIVSKCSTGLPVIFKERAKT
ncbi:hypothetical protein Trydic_g695 [Trypoxylus dichotomus]